MLFESSFSEVLIVFLTVTCGVVAGVLLHSGWIRRTARNRMAIPKDWPLNPRVLANTEERRVWVWLCEVFYNHHVTVKTPVTRFTLPRQAEQGQHWYNLLSSVYCTFTICGQDGKVIGCVDVLGRSGLSRRNWRLKRSLLSQCDMAYLVVEPGSLPTTAKIRSLFLGEEAAKQYAREIELEEIRIATARLKLSTALERQRRNRSIDAESSRPQAASGFSAGDSVLSGESGFGTSSNFGPSGDSSDDWQENSFLAPLDSRLADIRS